jgi:hypothetical protein
MDWRRTLAQSQNQQQGHADFLERLPGGKAHAMALGAPTPGDEHAHGRLAINAVLKKIGGTASAALPKKLRHEERGRASLPGVLSAASLDEVFAQAGDPVRNLLTATLGKQLGRTGKVEGDGQ